jgi:hypothetical protein
MDIYERASTWKIYLALVGVVIVIITMYYSNFLANKLAANEVKNVKLFAQSIEEIYNNQDLNADFSLQDTIIATINIPLILENEKGGLSGFNWSGGKDADEAFLEKRKNKILKKGYPPLRGNGYSSYIYYENSRLYTLITYFPIVQVLLLAAFIAFGYIGFSSAKRAEQNRVWAGMAKETAHQLGTPISAIVAWIEHLKELSVDKPEQMEIIGELTNDVKRLELIADRFSKIGSSPKLEQTNIFSELEKCKNYMQKRASRKIKFDFPTSNNEPKTVMINRHLFDWVIENILRNSLDAMEGVGTISARIYEIENMIGIDLSDTGKGIASNKFYTVFKPGYSTKKRGWGLGLSLAKRIIEEYHKGKIFVKKSVLNEGTTFTIKLPKV